MARPVHIDFSDEIVRIELDTDCGNVFVHKHLLSERSQKFKDYLELISELPEEENFIDLGHYFLGQQALQYYASFLYGQPMLTDDEMANSKDLKLKYWHLMELNGICIKWNDYQAADATVDAIREVLNKVGKDLRDLFDMVLNFRIDFGAPRGRLMADFMVHEYAGSDTFGKWVSNFREYCAEGEECELDEALAKALAAEAERKKAGRGPPDLMERCKYHSHTEQGHTCYLDKQ